MAYVSTPPTVKKDRKLVSHIGTLLTYHPPAEIKGRIIAAGLSFDTADRFLAGETGFSINTLAKIAIEFDTKISDLIELE